MKCFYCRKQLEGTLIRCDDCLEERGFPIIKKMGDGWADKYSPAAKKRLTELQSGQA